MICWGTYDVTLNGVTWRCGARTHSHARAYAVQAYQSVYGGKFKDIATATRVRTVKDPDSRCYDYIREQYNVSVAIGDRVRVPDLSGASKRIGVVVHPGRSSVPYVAVGLEGEKNPLSFHPLDIERIDRLEVV